MRRRQNSLYRTSEMVAIFQSSRARIILVCLLILKDQADCWTAKERGGLSRRSSGKIHRGAGEQNSSISSTLFSSVNDYEYIPPRRGLSDTSPSSKSANPLASSYPDGTPAGLKGEAVRSALRSGRCIGWSLQNSPLDFGLIRITGSGTPDFCHSKLTQSFTDIKSSERHLFREACLLNARGHIVDRISVSLLLPPSGSGSSSPSTSPQTTAFLMTSPGNTAQALLSRLEPFVFPMDQVTLKAMTTSCIFTLASTRNEHLQTSFDSFIQPMLQRDFPMNDDSSHLSTLSSPSLILPTKGRCTFVETSQLDRSLLILPTLLLPDCVGQGYTFCFLDQAAAIGRRIWEQLMSDDNEKGPIQVGPLEFQTMQIESGWPAFGYEMTGSTASVKSSASLQSRQSADVGGNRQPQPPPASTPASPLELHLIDRIDMDKGCYLGQEGIASTLKNPRGPPRSLYQIVFDDDFNVYESDEDDVLENLTRVPEAGAKLYVLGSNQEISVGTITSIAEPGGTGDACTVGLALIRRSDSILKQMSAMGLKIERPFVPRDEDLIGVAPSKPKELSKDQLEGLEVIIGGSFTIGRLHTVPSRRFGSRMNMFDEDVIYDMDSRSGSESESRRTSPESSEEPLEDKRPLASTEDVVRPQKREETDSEAQRKAEKLEILRQRAEEAMARRKAKK